MKKFKRFLSVFLVVLIIFGAVPITSYAASNDQFEAVDVNDNVFLDALKYTGYDTSYFIKNGAYGSNSNRCNLPSSVLSGIGYNTGGASGLETKNGKPDIDAFKSNGLCCASYAAYVYFNYLPNVAGIDTSDLAKPSNPRSTASWETACEKWVSAGKAEKIKINASTESSSALKALDDVPIGSILIFKDNSGDTVHTAIYAGKKNDPWGEARYYQTNVGTSRGPEVASINYFEKDGVSCIITDAYIPENNSYGEIHISKKDPNGKNLSGAEFEAVNESTGEKFKIGPTDINGEAFAEVPYGVYNVKETVFPKFHTAYGQTEWRVLVSAANNGIITINAVNTPATGSVSLKKTSESGNVKGFKFHLYGTADIGVEVDEYGTSSETGDLTFNNLYVGTFTIEEVDIPSEFVTPQKQTITVEEGKVTKVTFDNLLKKFRVQVTKTDANTVTPQGNSSLAGAVYGMFNNGELVDTYTTDSKGSFTTKYYICGENWTLREISPSPGYLLDETVHKIGAEPKLYSVEFNTISLEVTEEPIYGSIAIIKHTDDGSTQIETPEVGAEFEIFLKAAGSYAAAKASERDIIVCDDFGYGKTKELPYGLYTVHQSKGWEGRELIADFDVYISQNGKVYPFLINNSSFESYVKIVKIDAETGKAIPYAGAGFQIYTPEGELITHTITYPTPTTIDTFYTNSEGYLVTPETLPFGSGYSLVEVQAPYGYVLDSTPIYFDINQEDSTKEDTLTVIVVERPNVAQKGVIEITKTGEVFSSVKNSNDIYSPVFEVKGLAEATYEIYAYEDIVTLEGTVRAVAGELVDTVTTGADGIGKSKPLYLGKYLAKEKIAPDTMVLNSEEYLVELVYAGQEVEITSTALSVYNERQKVEISLSKVLENDDLYGIGNNGEISAVQFGIFAAEEITAADGSVIPTDGLITFANCNENGKLIFDCDLPIGFKWYAKEISTDEHYILSDEKYEFDTVYQGQDIEVIDIRINDGEAIENELKRGFVQGIKVGENNEPLAGALIGIFAPGTTKFTEETAIATVVSAVDGSFAFEGVPYGEWVVAEIKAPTGFVLDNTQHHVYISDDEVIINIKIENEKIRGRLEISKTDVSTGEPLPNVGFRIYDKDKNVIVEGYTDEGGKLLVENLVYGDYFYQEFSCGEAYVLDDTLYPFSIRENGVTVKVEMTNRMKQGKLIILKIDPSDREKILEGVVFVIEDENGSFVAEITTDKTSIAEIELTYGKYVVYEKSTLTGYMLDITKHEIEITEDGEIIEITVENSRIPEDTPNVNTPYTGDNRNYGVVIGICMIAFGAAVSAVILKIKSRKAEDED